MSAYREKKNLTAEAKKKRENEGKHQVFHSLFRLL
jgi:hypothetical protein